MVGKRDEIGQCLILWMQEFGLVMLVWYIVDWLERNGIVDLWDRVVYVIDML